MAIENSSGDGLKKLNDWKFLFTDNLEHRHKSEEKLMSEMFEV